MAQSIPTIPFRPSFGGSFEELYNPPEIAGKWMDVPGFYGSAGFDLGTPSELTETTAAPATGPSGSLGASSLQPNNPYGIDLSNLDKEEKFQLMEIIKKLLKKPSPTFPEILEINDIDGVRIKFHNGWGLVRASNTTPVLVTRFESTLEKDAKRYRASVNDLIDLAKALI